jgi:hypothetical protein
VVAEVYVEPGDVVSPDDLLVLLQPRLDAPSS